MHPLIRTCLLLAVCVASAPALAQQDAPAPTSATAASPAAGPAGPVLEAGRRPLSPPVSALSGGLGERAPLPAALRPVAPAAASGLDGAAARPPGRYTTWGMIIGGAVGLTYGLIARDAEFLDMSPVLETIVGAGVGLYVGGAIDLMRGWR